MRRFISLLLFLITLLTGYAQNPFAAYGYKPKMATLSNGRFDEFHDKDRIVEIGSVRFDTKTNKIVGYVEPDTLEAAMDVQTVSRFISIDPHAERYYSISPYAYCNNNPVRFIDPTGKFPIETFWDIANVVYDIGAAVGNHIVGDHSTAKSHWVDLGLDAVATLTPYVPAGVTKAFKAGDKAVDGIKATQRGVQNEAKVLEDIGEVKNTVKTTVTLPGTKEKVTVIPDVVNDTKVIEIKDVKSLSNTKQIKGERQAAKEVGKDFKVITGEKTHVSRNIPVEEIIRRKDIGPQ